MASAGRILIMPKGNYDSSVSYEMLDMVYYNGTSWVAKKAVKGIEPSAANSEYWHNLINISVETIGALSINGGTLTGNATIKKEIPTLALEVDDKHSTTLIKNANSNVDNGTELTDDTDNVRTILTLKDGTLRLFKLVDGVHVGSKIIAQITD